MQYIVPQFIEREAKIFGPFTFKQFIFVGTAGGFCIFLYFLLPFHVFLLLTIILVGGGFALAFLRINGIPLPLVIKNSLVFLTRPKIYLWGKKAIPPKFLKKAEKPIEEIKEETVLKISQRSRLGKLSTFLETKAK